MFLKSESSGCEKAGQDGPRTGPANHGGLDKGAPDVESLRCVATWVWEGGRNHEAKRLARMLCCV